jgi:hypothetical protein
LTSTVSARVATLLEANAQYIRGVRGSTPRTPVTHRLLARTRKRALTARAGAASSGGVDVSLGNHTDVVREDENEYHLRPAMPVRVTVDMS